MAQIRKRGPQQYQARIRLKGQPEVSKTFQSRFDAVEWTRGTEKLLQQNLGDVIRHAQRLTLSQALEKYCTDVTCTKKSWKQETVRLRKWQCHFLSERALPEIRGADLATYRDARLAEGIGANTVRLELALISHLYEVAIKDWGLETLVNPVKKIRKPKLPRGRDRRLYPGEEESLLAYCIQSGDLQLHTLIVLAIETAMRRGEITSLTWQQIHLDKRMVFLADTKNGESRQVPLSVRAFEYLQNLGEREGRLLKRHPDLFSTGFNRACKACGISGLTLHDLRHEATSRLFEKGLNMMEVATITGHKSLSMLKRYTHLRPADLIHKLG